VCYLYPFIGIAIAIERWFEFVDYSTRSASDFFNAAIEN
jgi:hypothetical protein